MPTPSDLSSDLGFTEKLGAKKLIAALDSHAGTDAQALAVGTIEGGASVVTVTGTHLFAATKTIGPIGVSDVPLTSITGVQTGRDGSAFKVSVQHAGGAVEFKTTPKGAERVASAVRAGRDA